MKSRYVDVQWPAPSRVRALMTTRHGGASRGPFASFNLATHCGDDAAAVDANRVALARDGAPPVVWLEQIHGVDVIDAATATGVPRADAAFCRVPARACAVMVADCLPVLICDRAASVVAAVHCGWRGLAHGVLTALLGRLRTPPEELLAWLGPAIGQRRYEVGVEVYEAFARARGAAAVATGFVRTEKPDKWRADLVALARSELAEFGVTAVHGGGMCTYDDERFYSYRRDGRTGRMAALIWLSNGG
jgi:YfiH family protein